MKFLKFWFPVLLYCCIIFGASSIQTVEFPPGLPYTDKVIHALEYGILAFLVARAVRGTNPGAPIPLIFAISVYFVLFYGVTDEFHQSFVRGRSADFDDLMADTIGGAAGALGYLLLKRKQTATC